MRTEMMVFIFPLLVLGFRGGQGDIIQKKKNTMSQKAFESKCKKLNLSKNFNLVFIGWQLQVGRDSVPFCTPAYNIENNLSKGS